MTVGRRVGRGGGELTTLMNIVGCSINRPVHSLMHCEYKEPEPVLQLGSPRIRFALHALMFQLTSCFM